MLSISEMHKQFRIEYDSIDSFSNPEYSAEEVDYFLNSAQDTLVEQAKVVGTEKDQTLRDMLANITENFISSTFLTNASNEPNGVFVELPSDYRTSLKESVTIEFANCNDVDTTKRIPVVPSTHDRLNVDVRNPFKKPNKRERVISVPFKYLSGDPSIQSIELLTDGTFTITSFHLRYLKNPRKMQYGTQYATPTVDVDCELNIEAQNWIIKEAAIAAFKATNQLQKVQLLKQLDK
jgi:hypothetical protein